MFKILFFFTFAASVYLCCNVSVVNAQNLDHSANKNHFTSNHDHIGTFDLTFPVEEECDDDDKQISETSVDNFKCIQRVPECNGASYFGSHFEVIPEALFLLFHQLKIPF